jgi:hypothetical protein
MVRQIINIIKNGMKTLNYELFKIIETNRPTVEGHVNAIAKSIENNGYIEAYPILVNEEFGIIDGQHRFLACKKLNLPIVFTQIAGHTEKLMIDLNTTSTNWHLLDYAMSNAKKGIKCYQALIELENKYRLGISNSIVITRNSYGGNAGKEFSQGKEWEVNPRRNEIAEFVLNQKQYLAFYRTKPFVASIANLFNRAKSEEIKKVEKVLMSIKEQVKVSDYMNIYENIINRRNRGGNYIKLQ